MLTPVRWLLGSVTMSICLVASASTQPRTSSEGARADWDHVAAGAQWTRITAEQLRSIGQPLLDTVPRDVASFCPRYSSMARDDRVAFWVALISAMARFESGFDPGVSFDEYAHCRTDDCRRRMTTRDGRHVVSRGLLQLSQESANNYRGCSVAPRDEARLHDAAVNLTCSVAIMNRLVTRDGAISARPRPGSGELLIGACCASRTVATPCRKYDSSPDRCRSAAMQAAYVDRGARFTEKAGR